ncbi:MAG: ShET2/EspL2 family type III secretion system effector toxin [Pseudomonadota bacterium]
MPPKLGPVGPSTTVAASSSSSPPPPTPQQARQALAEALQPLQAGTAPESGVVDALLLCLDGNRLDLNQMLPQWHALVFQLPEAVWAALDACARAGGAAGIGWIGLPAPESDAQLQPALTRMNPLAQLRELLLRVPRTGDSLTLQPLFGGPVNQVEIDFWRDDFMQVLAPDALKVRARRSRPDYLTQKDVQQLRRTDAAGRYTGVRGPVPDLGYFRSPTDFDGPDRYRQALLLNLNGEVRFEAKHESAVALDVPTKDPSVIHCRHIAVALIKARREYLHAKATASPSAAPRKRFSFQAFAQPADLARQVGLAAETEYLEIQRAQVPTMFTVPTFGQALANQFRQMGHGQARHFLIITNNHALVVELQHKRRDAAGKPSEDRVILFYDPNITASAWRTVVSDLDRLATRSLAEWLPEVHLHKYLGHEEPRTALMYRWAEPGSAEWDALAGSPGGIYGFESGVTPGQALRYLRTALEAGQAKAVHDTLASLFANRAFNDAQLHRMVGATFPHAHDGTPPPGDGKAAPAGGASTKPERSTLNYAMNFRRPAAVAAYLRGILCTPDLRLSSQQRMDLTRDWPQFECTTVYARALLAAGADLVGDDAVRERFWQVPRWADSTKNAPPAPSDPAPHFSHQYWYDIVHEVAVCPTGGRAFYASRTRGWQVDVLALAMDVPNPCTAAAMLCAAFEARIDPSRRQSLLGWVGKHPESVLKALVASAGPHDLHWGARLLRALPPTLYRRLAPSLQTLVDPGFVPPSQADPAARLLAAPTVWMARTGLPAQGYEAAGLRALHLDSNPTWMVCTADEPIAELVGLRVEPGTRLGPDMSFEGLRYLLPVSQLHAGSAKVEVEADHKASSVTTTSTPTPRPQQWKIVDA